MVKRYQNKHLILIYRQKIRYKNRDLILNTQSEDRAVVVLSVQRKYEKSYTFYI